MIDICFGCGKEMEWAVDDYVFRWAKVGNIHRVMPFCHGCKSDKTKREQQHKPKPREPEQLSLF